MKIFDRLTQWKRILFGEECRHCGASTAWCEITGACAGFSYCPNCNPPWWRK